MAQRMQGTLSCVSLLVLSAPHPAWQVLGSYTSVPCTQHIGFPWLQTPQEHKQFKTHMVSTFLGCQSETPPHCIKYVSPGRGSGLYTSDTICSAT